MSAHPAAAPPTYRPRVRKHGRLVWRTERARAAALTRWRGPAHPATVEAGAKSRRAFRSGVVTVRQRWHPARPTLSLGSADLDAARVRYTRAHARMKALASRRPADDPERARALSEWQAARADLARALDAA